MPRLSCYFEEESNDIWYIGVYSFQIDGWMIDTKWYTKRYTKFDWIQPRRDPESLIRQWSIIFSQSQSQPESLVHTQRGDRGASKPSCRRRSALRVQLDGLWLHKGCSRRWYGCRPFWYGSDMKFNAPVSVCFRLAPGLVWSAKNSILIWPHGSLIFFILLSCNLIFHFWNVSD